MKNLFFVLFISMVFNTNAQNIEDLLVSGKKDASIYLGHYIEPVNKGLIYNLNNGWYHTGKTHEKYGFDITIQATASLVPENDKTFTFRNSNYTNLALQSGLSSDNLPTVMGGDSNQLIDVRIPVDALGNTVPLGTQAGFKIASFETLDGIEDELPIAAVPTPMVQFGLGLPSKTDLKLRFVPNVGSDDVTFNLFGIGLQHNILQHFKVTDRNPIFDLSVLAAFTTSKTVYTPKDSSIGINQETIININAYTAQLIGNVDLKIINFYAGIGYVAGSSSVKVLGDYTFNYNYVGVPLPSTSAVIHDPIDINHSLSGIKTTLGMRLNIAWFKIFADYTIQEYHTANAGIAFSFK